MGFLSPALLWLAAGGSIPVIIHLLFRQRYRIVRWAAVEFLLAAIKRTQRRLRLENLLLLLVRILTLVLLAFALAQPRILHEVPILQAQKTHYVIALDASYSMGYRTGEKSHFERAQEDAAALIDGLDPFTEDDFLSVLTFSAQPEVVVDQANRKETAIEEVRALKISHFPSDLPAALRRLEETLEATPEGMVRRVFLFTDLQRNAWVPASEARRQQVRERLRAMTSRGDTRVTLVDAAGREMSNLAVVALRQEGPAPTTRESVRFVAEAYNFSDAEAVTPVALVINGEVKGQRRLAVSRRAGAPVEFSWRFDEAGPHAVSVRLEADSLELDDQRHLALEVADAVRVLGLDGHPEARVRPRDPPGELGFFKVALDSFGTVQFFDVRVLEPRMARPEAVAEASVVVLGNVPSLPPDLLRALREFVEAGGGLWIALGEEIDPEFYNETLWADGEGLLPAKLDSRTGDVGGAGFHLSAIRMDHPVLAGLNDPMRGFLRKILYYRFWKLDPATVDPEAVIARFDDPSVSPLWVEKRVGEGRVLLQTAPLSPAWDELPRLHTNVVIVHKVVQHLARRPAGLRNVFVGETIAARLPAGLLSYGRTFEVQQPENAAAARVYPEHEEGDRYFRLHFPSRPAGVGAPAPVVLRLAGPYPLYQLRQEGRHLTAVFAANLPPRRAEPEALASCESNLARISADELREKYPDFTFSLRGGRGDEERRPDLTAEGTDLARTVLLFVLGLLATESVMALVFGLRKQ